MHNSKHIVLLLAFGAGLSSRQRIHIDLDKMRFRPTIEVGPLKFGKWKKIENPEYISVFDRNKVDGSETYEVNLWHDTNKHLEMFEFSELNEAFYKGFEISEILNIDLLDATENNNYKWVDKPKTLETGEITYK